MGAKQRFEDRVEISAIIGDVAGKDAIVIDDEIAKGSSMIELLGHLRRRGAKSVRVACTHGLFSSGALDRLEAEDDILEIVCTNTVPVEAAQGRRKLVVLSIAPALAEAMRRIHAGESVSELFDA
jgi:ribose-phosphate pyrophosphokinase